MLFYYLMQISDQTHSFVKQSPAIL